MPGFPLENVFFVVIAWNAAPDSNFFHGQFLKGDRVPSTLDPSYHYTNLLVMPVEAVKAWVSPTLSNLFEWTVSRDDRMY